jgi:hypothetical protein
MKFLVACLVCAEVMFITAVIAEVFSPYNPIWQNLIWWLGGAISVGITVFMISRME